MLDINWMMNCLRFLILCSLVISSVCRLLFTGNDLNVAGPWAVDTDVRPLRVFNISFALTLPSKWLIFVDTRVEAKLFISPKRSLSDFCQFFVFVCCILAKWKLKLLAAWPLTAHDERFEWILYCSMLTELSSVVPSESRTRLLLIKNIHPTSLR